MVKLFQFLEEVDKEKVVSIHFDPNMIINCFEVASIGGIDMALVSKIFSRVFCSLIQLMWIRASLFFKTTYKEERRQNYEPKNY